MRYVGSELDLFATAMQWKRYVRDRLTPHIKGRTLEVGAGIGAFTEVLAPIAPDGWCCLEPDASLVAQIERRREAGRVPATASVICGTLSDLPEDSTYDTIMYLDVIEHIADDAEEAAHAAARLSRGGCLIVLAPAFQSVYSPFDAAIGHHRRYTSTTLERIRPTNLRTLAAYYMDAPGLVLSLANRLLLRSAAPKPGQIAFWDSRIVPMARWLDPLVGRTFGRSVVAIWQCPMEADLS
jgi:SAM-dependent methyltransferase